MGKISQYSRQKFQSTYIGGPQVNKSGSIIAGGVANAVAPVIEQQTRTQEAKIGASIEQQADNAAVQYSLKYQNMVAELQKTYANDPSKVMPEAMKKGEILAESMGQGIPDERVRARFLSGANTMTKQSATGLVKWGRAKLKENGEIAVVETVNTMAFTLGPSGNYATFKSNMDAMTAKAQKLKGFQQEHLRKAMPGYYDTHVYLRATNAPDGFEKELSLYKDLPNLPKDFRVKALKAIETQRKKEKAELVVIQRENRYVLGNEIINEEIPPTEMLARIDGVKNSIGDGKGLTTSDYGWLKKAYFAKIKGDTLQMIEDDDTVYSQKFVTAIDKVAKNLTDKRQRQAVLVQMSVDGFNTNEVRELNTLYGFSNAPVSKRALSVLGEAWGHMRGTLEDEGDQYSFMKEWTSRVVKGEEPRKVTEEISAAVTAHQARKDNPAIANFPVSGQLMMNADGGSARVLPNGTKEVK